MARTSLSSLSRRLGGVVLAGVVALVPAACGGSSTEDGDRSPETSAEGPAEGEESSPTEGTGGTEGTGDNGEPAGPELAELSAEEFYPAIIGAFEEAGTARFTVTTATSGSDVPGASTDMEGVLRYDEEGVDVHASSTGAQPMEVLMVDRGLYIQGAGLDLGDKSWLEVDLDDPGQAGSLFGFIGKATDPEVMFGALAEPKEFELVGQEDLDGVATHHYHVVLDSAAYAEAMELPDFMLDFLPETLPMDMWVDAEHRLRRFEQEIETEVPSSGGGEPATTTATTAGTYRDFGAEVEIEAPPASEVTDSLKPAGGAG